MRSRRLDTLWIVAPVLMGLFVSWLAILGLSYSATVEMDANALARETRLAKSALNLIDKEITATAGDYSFWGEAIAKLIVAPDPAWAEETFGKHLYEAFGIDGVYVISAEGRIQMAFKDGLPSDDHVHEMASADLRAMMARSEDQTTSQSIPVSGLFRSEGDVHAVAVSIFQQEGDDPALALPHPRPALMLSRTITPEVLGRSAEMLQLPGLSLQAMASVPASIPLTDPKGTTIGHLAWNFTPPGNHFINLVGLPIAGALLFTLIFAYLFVQRARRIVETQQQLRTASAVKSQFLANVSHELRTPLNAIIGFSDAIRSAVFGPIENKNYRAYIEDIHGAGMHLLALIDDILDIATIEAGRLSFREEKLAPDTLLQAAVVFVRPQMSAKNIEFGIAPAPTGFKLLADARRLRQVLINLLSNAVKFTPNGGAVDIITDVTPSGQLMIQIQDTGIGMSDDELEIALRPFGQVENSLTRSHEGTGLGLPLSISLVEMHEGTLKVESRKGVGTTVTILLPASRLIWD